LRKSFIERFGSGVAGGGDRWWWHPRERERVGKMKERRGRRKRRRPNHYTDKSAHLVGTLLCHKCTSDVGALPDNVA
jgi:hypothetical protein